MSKVLCDICHGCGCAHCGGLGFFIEDGPEDDREPPTFEEFYSEEIKAAGYVKLEPGQVVVNASDVGDALDALCDTCAGNCEMCPTREILFAIKEARDARV
jgi:hypothetical protein